MVHVGELGHPIGCDCIECFEGRQTDTLADRATEIRYQLETGTVTQGERETLERELTGLEVQLDRQ